jgi:hypothetical protein
LALIVASSGQAQNLRPQKTTKRANENALWIGSRLVSLSRARFTFNPSDPMDEWKVETEELKLRFEPIHAHREERDYKLVKSHFIQTLGMFEGGLRLGDEAIQIEKLAGSPRIRTSSGESLLTWVADLP